MSKSKELLEWAKEIGLVAGMIFKNKDKQYDFEIIEVQPNEIRVRWLEDNYTSIGFMEIVCFTFDYKLIFDPRSEKESPKMEKTFKQTLQENTQTVIDFRNEEDERVYKNFSENLKTELLNYTKKSDKFSYHCDNELAERFCKENGLEYDYVTGSMNHHKISWE